MAEYLGVPREQIDVVYHRHLRRIIFSTRRPRTRTIRRPEPRCPPADRRLPRPHLPGKGPGPADRRDGLPATPCPGMADVRLKVAGYVGGRDEKWYEALQNASPSRRLAGNVTWHGEVTRGRSWRCSTRSTSSASPAAYPEAKGIYVLEALARGVPVVQPAHGSFPELIEATGGGVLVPPGDAGRWPRRWPDCCATPPAAKPWARPGEKPSEAFTDDHMAENMVKVYEDTPPPAVRRSPRSRRADETAFGGTDILVVMCRRVEGHSAPPEPAHPALQRDGQTRMSISPQARMPVPPVTQRRHRGRT